MKLRLNLRGLLERVFRNAIHGVIFFVVAAAISIIFLYSFPFVTGERFLLVIDVLLFFAMLVYLLADSVKIKKELYEFIDSQDHLSEDEKNSLKRYLSSVYDVEDILRVPEYILKKRVGSEIKIPVKASVNGISYSSVPRDLVAVLQKLSRDIDLIYEKIQKIEKDSGSTDRKSRVCPYCGSDNVVVDNGFLFCLDCGRVKKIGGKSVKKSRK